MDGRPLIAGTNIVGKGWAKGVAGQAVAGAIGGAVGSAMGTGSVAKITTGMKGFLALTADELLLMTLGGLMVLKPKDVVARVPRSEVASITMGKQNAVSAPLDVTFTAGSVWQFEVPRPTMANGRDLVEKFA
ncbi:hypothetical protein [Propioniciclava tarda]|uniref:hypothetical protein n=1 Tax=Propioniciclava tarda TaxID=433330 RepID=UPI001037411D|nr:hypothetical protein [Propioniciclava tarda]